MIGQSHRPGRSNSGLARYSGDDSYHDGSGRSGDQGPGIRDLDRARTGDVPPPGSGSPLKEGSSGRRRGDQGRKAAGLRVEMLHPLERKAYDQLVADLSRRCRSVNPTDFGFRGELGPISKRRGEPLKADESRRSVVGVRVAGRWRPEPSHKLRKRPLGIPQSSDSTTDSLTNTELSLRGKPSHQVPSPSPGRRGVSGMTRSYVKSLAVIAAFLTLSRLACTGINTH